MTSISEFVFPKNFPRYEDTSDPQATVYEGIPFMGVWGFSWGMLQGRCSFLMTFARNGWSSNWAVMGWAIVECVASGADGTNSGGGDGFECQMFVAGYFFNYKY